MRCTVDARGATDAGGCQRMPADSDDALTGGSHVSRDAAIAGGSWDSQRCHDYMRAPWDSRYGRCACQTPGQLDALVTDWWRLCRRVQRGHACVTGSDERARAGCDEKHDTLGCGCFCRLPVALMTDRDRDYVRDRHVRDSCCAPAELDVRTRSSRIGGGSPGRFDRLIARSHTKHDAFGGWVLLSLMTGGSSD